MRLGMPVWMGLEPGPDPTTGEPDYDVLDDPACRCETCTTTWGTDIPTVLLNPPR